MAQREPCLSAFLASQSAFARLPPDVLELLAERMTPERFEAGSFILCQDEAGDCLFFVEQGEAEVRLQRPGGEVHVLATLGPGDVIGEMALITGAPRNADVVAVSPVRSQCLRAPDFYELMVQNPQIAVLLTNVVADRLGRDVLDGLGDKVLHGYRIRRPLGRGAMAVVYEAEDCADGERVALKMMSHRLSLNETAMERFQMEADLLESLDHTGVARYRGRFDSYGTCFLVMEYCDGPNLAELITHAHPLPLDEVRKILGSLALALRHVHAAGIVHCDLKPANVMLNLDGSVKLTDFGIASSFPPEVEEETGISVPVVGTPRYMAPEQFASARPVPQVDLYALGCIAHEMVMGEPLFRDRDLAIMVEKKRKWILPYEDRLESRWTHDLQAVMESCLQPDPEERQLDLAELGEWAGRADCELIRGVMEARGPGPGLGDAHTAE